MSDRSRKRPAAIEEGVALARKRQQLVLGYLTALDRFQIADLEPVAELVELSEGIFCAERAQDALIKLKLALGKGDREAVALLLSHTLKANSAPSGNPTDEDDAHYYLGFYAAVLQHCPPENINLSAIHEALSELPSSDDEGSLAAVAAAAKKKNLRALFLALRKLNAAFWEDIRKAFEPPALPPFRGLADLKGKEVAVSGIFDNAGHTEIERLVEQHGGIVRKSVSRATDIVLFGGGRDDGATPDHVIRARQLRNEGMPIRIVEGDELTTVLRVILS